MSRLKNWIILLVAILMIFGITACDANQDNVGSGESNTHIETQKNDDKSTIDWEIKIDGKRINLPCTLAEIEKKNVTIAQNDREAILNSTNEEFVVVATVNDDDAKLISLVITTGDKPDKKEANAVVEGLINMDIDASAFELKGGIALGSSLDDIVKVFGDDYEVAAALSDDLYDGYVVINYGEKSNKAIFHFDDAVLGYIEIKAGKGE